MSVWQLVIKEIVQRKANFISGLVAVTLATAVLAGSMTILRLHDLRTERFYKPVTISDMRAVGDGSVKTAWPLDISPRVYPEKWKP